jgi:hypothetical protein
MDEDNVSPQEESMVLHDAAQMKTISKLAPIYLIARQRSECKCSGTIPLLLRCQVSLASHRTVRVGLPIDIKLERFLTAPARNHVTASTRNQVFNAIVFFHEAMGAIEGQLQTRRRGIVLSCSASDGGS